MAKQILIVESATISVTDKPDGKYLFITEKVSSDFVNGCQTVYGHGIIASREPSIDKPLILCAKKPRSTSNQGDRLNTQQYMECTASGNFILSTDGNTFKLSKVMQ